MLLLTSLKEFFTTKTQLITSSPQERGTSERWSEVESNGLLTKKSATELNPSLAGQKTS